MLTRHRSAALIVAAAALAAITAACGGANPAAPTAPSPTMTTGPVLGPSRLSAPQLVAWFNSRSPRPAGEYAATVPV